MAQLVGQFTDVIDKKTNFPGVFETVGNLLAQSTVACKSDSNGPWLLDSKRDYMTQLSSYYLHKLR